MKQAEKYHRKQEQDHGNLSHRKRSRVVLKSERSSCETGAKHHRKQDPYCSLCDLNFHYPTLAFHDTLQTASCKLSPTFQDPPFAFFVNKISMILVLLSTMLSTGFT